MNTRCAGKVQPGVEEEEPQERHCAQTGLLQVRLRGTDDDLVSSCTFDSSLDLLLCSFLRLSLSPQEHWAADCPSAVFNDAAPAPATEDGTAQPDQQDPHLTDQDAQLSDSVAADAAVPTTDAVQESTDSAALASPWSESQVRQPAKRASAKARSSTKTAVKTTTTKAAAGTAKRPARGATKQTSSGAPAKRAVVKPRPRRTKATPEPEPETDAEGNEDAGLDTGGADIEPLPVYGDDDVEEIDADLLDAVLRMDAEESQDAAPPEQADSDPEDQTAAAPAAAGQQGDAGKGGSKAKRRKSAGPLTIDAALEHVSVVGCVFFG
jgi:hypothetical protein